MNSEQNTGLEVCFSFNYLFEHKNFLKVYWDFIFLIHLPFVAIADIITYWCQFSLQPIRSDSIVPIENILPTYLQSDEGNISRVAANILGVI